MASLVFVSACGDSSPAEPSTDTQFELVTTTTTPEQLLELPDITGSLETLVAFIGYEPKFTNVNLGQFRINVTIQQEDDPIKLDAYASSADPLTGELLWTGPTPVEVDADEIPRIPAQLFERSEFRWEAVPMLAEAAVEGLVAIEPTQVVGASASRSFIQDRSSPEPKFIDQGLSFRLSVEGLRGAGSLVADAQGNVLDVARS